MHPSRSTGISAITEEKEAENFTAPTNERDAILSKDGIPDFLLRRERKVLHVEAGGLFF